MRGGGTEWGVRSGKYDIMFSSSLHIFCPFFIHKLQSKLLACRK